MNRLAVFSALCLAAVSSAQEPPSVPIVAGDAVPAALPVKVATIFAQNAIVSTQEGQKASAALNAKFAPRKAEFEHKQREVQALRDQLKKTQATMSADARQRLNQTIDDRNRELQRLGEDSQAALEEEEGALLQELGDKMLGIIGDYAQRNGYVAVFDVSNPQGPVRWASPRVDITNEIVKLYDQAHPVAPAPVTPPTPVVPAPARK
jgi:outer membrane protein